MTTQSPEREVLELAAEIFATEAKLTQLRARLSSFLLGSGATPIAPAPPTPPPIITVRRGPAAARAVGVWMPSDNSVGQRVLAAFKRRPGKVVALQSVVDELVGPGATPETIRTAAARFARLAKGRSYGLRKAGRGKYKFVPEPQEDAH